MILSLDQGTTSSRAILFDDAGAAVAIAQREFRQLFPKPGWVEHDPEEIWRTQSAVAHEAVRSAGVAWRDVQALGVTNQRETTVVWDRETGLPLHNAIVWQDRRTSDFCAGLQTDGLEDRFREKTGLRLDPYFSGTKLRWLLDHVDGARELAKNGRLCFGTIDSWIIWNLTGGDRHVTDASNASRTLLLNIHSLEWDDELLGILKVPRAILPEICASSGVVGETSPAFADTSIPIAGIAGDQQSALFGQLCVESGSAKNTYGTGCFLLKNTGTHVVPSKHDLVTTVGWQMNNETTYALEGSVFIGGAVVQWLRDGLGIIKSSADVESLARSVDDSGGAFLVPAFAGLGAPYWDPYARGTITGLTRGTTSAHLARAALDAIAFQSAEVMIAMDADSGPADRLSELKVDGAAARNDLLMQIQADLMQVPVIRPTSTETTALGAAYLAGLATGFWESVDVLADNWNVDRIFEPLISADEAEARLAGWRRAVERSRGWANDERFDAGASSQRGER